MAKKKKLKKILKGLGVGAALLGAGKALMSRRDRNAMINAASADDGFGDMKLKDYGPYSIGNDFIPQEPSIVGRSRNKVFFSDGTTGTPGSLRMMKKGGRVKKGFAKKKKPANRMRKK